MYFAQRRCAVLVASFLAAYSSGPAWSCATALVLAIDVSNSIDAGEYRIQTDGLADAVIDPAVREALVSGKVALTVVQWSGRGSQQVVFPWTRMNTDADVDALSQAAREMKRVFIMSDTAVGDVIRFSLPLFAEVPDCGRKVIDISGDGTDNAGTDPQSARRQAEDANVQINGLAIESMGLSITNFFRRHVITRNGFVMTSRGHQSYAETLKRKIRREVSQVMF
jgi:Ca-activated chloride channel family protein